jgi:hypothetical protein
MSKPLSIILQGTEILASFTDYDTAVKEFRALKPEGHELSLHVLNRPDRRKGKPFVVKNVQPAPREPVKKNKQSVI